MEIQKIPYKEKMLLKHLSYSASCFGRPDSVDSGVPGSCGQATDQHASTGS